MLEWEGRVRDQTVSLSGRLAAPKYWSSEMFVSDASMLRTSFEQNRTLKHRCTKSVRLSLRDNHEARRKNSNTRLANCTDELHGGKLLAHAIPHRCVVCTPRTDEAKKSL